ncbi:hypothetical protein ACFWPH_19400 [Nocardia sp. NPDC058499]|uniref:hypothetical protein n=1 Tax=Nocardia sp. NPDC058499 TaxID=3346530 RepID=UPI003667C04B
MPRCLLGSRLLDRLVSEFTVRTPHPPVLVGGAGPTIVDRVFDFGDGWMPLYGRGTDNLPARITELRERADRPLQVTMFGVPPEPESLRRLDQLAGLI